MPPKKAAARKLTPLHWDRLAPDWWSSAAGFIRMEKNGTWSAHLYRNTRTGRAWTERKTGFITTDKARRWIEREAED
jgi:hypothetical protein